MKKRPPSSVFTPPRDKKANNKATPPRGPSSTEKIIDIFLRDQCSSNIGDSNSIPHAIDETTLLAISMLDSSKVIATLNNSFSKTKGEDSEDIIREDSPQPSNLQTTRKEGTIATLDNSFSKSKGKETGSIACEDCTEPEDFMTTTKEGVTMSVVADINLLPRIDTSNVPGPMMTVGGGIYPSTPNLNALVIEEVNEIIDESFDINNHQPIPKGLVPRLDQRDWYHV